MSGKLRSASRASRGLRAEPPSAPTACADTHASKYLIHAGICAHACVLVCLLVEVSSFRSPRTVHFRIGSKGVRKNFTSLNHRRAHLSRLCTTADDSDSDSAMVKRSGGKKRGRVVVSSDSDEGAQSELGAMRACIHYSTWHMHI